LAPSASTDWRAVASRGWHSACRPAALAMRSRRHTHGPHGARAPCAGAGRGGRSRRAGGTASARPAAIAMSSLRHIHGPCMLWKLFCVTFGNRRSSTYFPGSVLDRCRRGLDADRRPGPARSPSPTAERRGEPGRSRSPSRRRSRRTGRWRYQSQRQRRPRGPPRRETADRRGFWREPGPARPGATGSTRPSPLCSLRVDQPLGVSVPSAFSIERTYTIA
jgi:hypothetical protein